MITEQEIYIKKPNIEFYRIKEEYFDNYFNLLFDDLINIIKYKDYKPKLNYSSLTLQNKKS